MIFVDRSLRKIYTLAFNIEEDGFDDLELTATANHIIEDGVRQGHLAVAMRPDPRIYFVRSDGQLVCLTFLVKEKVVGFTRIVTDGVVESVAVIPRTGGRSDQVWITVRRTIGITERRYIEYLDDDAFNPDADAAFGTGRPWASLQTDSAVTQSSASAGATFTTVSGLSHLEGHTVDVVADGSYVGQKTVSGGAITLDEAATQVEVGLHYTSTAVSMRPTVPNVILEGLERSWDSLWARLYKTRGGTINGEWIQYPADPLNAPSVFTGDRRVTGQGWDTDGRITITQDQPYPMTVLAMFGTLTTGDHD